MRTLDKTPGVAKWSVCRCDNVPARLDRQHGVVIESGRGWLFISWLLPPWRGVGAQILGFKRSSVETLPLLEVDGPSSQHEVESAPEV